MKLKKLNNEGFSHHLVVIIFILIFAVAGVGYRVISHADNGAASYDPNTPATAPANTTQSSPPSPDKGTKKDPVGKGVNRELALEAVQYDTKSTNGKFRYKWAGLHGPLAELRSFQNGGGADCSGFVRFIIWKVYGKDVGAFTTQAMPGNRYFKQVSKKQVAAGDIGWRSDHVDFITYKTKSGKLHQFGAHSSATNIHGGSATLNSYQRYYRYIGPKS